MFAGLLNVSLAQQVDGEGAADKEAPVNCQLMLARGSCWEGFDINLRIIDAITFAAKGSVTLPESDNHVTVKLACEKLEQFTFQAKFSPEIWAGTGDTWYQAAEIWRVPEEISSEETWVLKLCFPHDFMRVPLPVDADISKCACTFP